MVLPLDMRAHIHTEDNKMEPTYRVVSLTDGNWAGKTAATPELARLGAGDLDREHLLGLERTDWGDNYGKPKAIRTVLVEAESQPGEWKLGVPALV